MAFEWENNGRLAFADIHDSFIVIPARQVLHTKKTGLDFIIEADPDKTAGFYTDTSPTCITPDLRGFYQQLKPGDKYSVTWKFSAATNTL